MKPRLVPHNRPPQGQNLRNGGSENASARACGGDRRRRSGGDDAGGRVALAEVDVAVVERRPDHVLVGSRAGGFHSRTIEVLDQRGVADRFLAEGQVAQAAMLATTVLDMSDFPTRHPYSLGIWQNQIERIMAAWIAELPVRIHHGCEVTGFAQDDNGVDVELSGDQSLRARYLVGCDGGRSVI